MGPLQLNSDTSSKVAQSSLPLPGFKKEQTESLQNFLTSSVAAALQQHTSFVEELPKFQSPLLEVQDPGVVTAIEVSFQTCKEPFSPGDVASAHVEVNRPKGEPKAEEVMSLKKYQGASVLWGAKAAKIEKSKRKADSLDESSLPAPKKARLTETAITQLEPDPDGPNAQPKVAHEILPICSDICGWLPADGVPGRAHLINVDSYLQSTGKPDLTMGDIVATILYNYSPGLLDAFFAINHKLEVSFTRNENAGSEHLDFCIERFDSTVYVSEASILPQGRLNKPA